jgi:hypothetical protein
VKNFQKKHARCNLQMQFDLRHRHNVELAALEAAEEQGTVPSSSSAGDEADADGGVEAVTAAAAASLSVGSSATPADDEKEKRRAKAQKKKQKALEKELERYTCTQFILAYAI